MSGRGERERRGVAEAVVFAIASGVLLAVAGAIGWLWLQSRDPAMLSVSRTEVSRRADGRSYVSAEVANDGDETAEAVQVIAEWRVDGEVVADGEQIVDFLSGGESQEVVFVFDDLEPEAEIVLRVASYAVP
jgi:uncharacterized protein (TIGR02588 family)